MFAADRQVTWLDHVRLFNLVRRARPGLALSPGAAEQAKDVLDMAELVDPQRVGADVVTMRSRVQLVRSSGETLVLTLSYPHEARAVDGFVSIFSPLGLRLLGARVGDQIEWCGPDGEAHRARVAALPYQPEAAGDFVS